MQILYHKKLIRLSKREKMKKIVLSLLCIGGFLYAKENIHSVVPLAESLKISADMMNKELPVMVDAELRHDKVEIDGNTMILKFTLVNFTKKEMNANRLKSLIEADIRKNVCDDVDSQMMLKKGMQVVYDYVDKNNQHITQFHYDTATCGLKPRRKIKVDDVNMVKRQKK